MHGIFYVYVTVAHHVRIPIELHRDRHCYRTPKGGGGVGGGRHAQGDKPT